MSSYRNDDELIIHLKLVYMIKPRWRKTHCSNRFDGNIPHLKLPLQYHDEHVPWSSDEERKIPSTRANLQTITSSLLVVLRKVSSETCNCPSLERTLNAESVRSAKVVDSWYPAFVHHIQTWTWSAQWFQSKVTRFRMAIRAHGSASICDSHCFLMWEPTTESLMDALCWHFWAASFSSVVTEEGAMEIIFYGASLLHPCQALSSQEFESKVCFHEILP
jgi:hypothetical protein